MRYPALFIVRLLVQRRSIPGRGRDAGLCLKEARDFARRGMATAGLFAVDQSVIDLDFEAPAAGGDEGQGCDRSREEGDQFFRQTGGARRVISLCAEFDADMHLSHDLSFHVRRWRQGVGPSLSQPGRIAPNWAEPGTQAQGRALADGAQPGRVPAWAGGFDASIGRML